jgi:hypothetical protein
MMKRIPVALLVIILFVLGLQSVKVTPAYASMIKASKIMSSLTSKSVNKNGSGILGEIRSFIIPSLLKGQTVNGVANKPAINLYSAYLGLAMTSTNETLLESIDSGLTQGGNYFDKYLGAIRLFISSSTLLESKTPDDVALNLTGADQINLTDPIVLSGVLRDLTTGAGIPNKSITFTTDGGYLGQTHTDDLGDFKIKINKDLRAGEYLVTASFKGAHLLASASAAFSFNILPATVKVETVPATAGITFQIDGRQFTSGQDGLASITIDQAGVYRLDVLLDQYHNPSQQVEFGRWSNESYQPFRDVQVPDSSAIQVGLDIFHKVNLKFVDLDGLPVDISRISEVTIRSVQGDVFTLKPGDTPWLPASRTARRQTGLDVTDLLYSVNSVTIDGSNVVNSAQQRFFVRTDDSWTISLLLYSLQIISKDGLFAAPVGKSIDVVFPNGQIKNYPLDSSGKLEIHALARGIYHASLLGIKGLGTSTPVALSRNQVVNLKIVTPLDIAVAGSIFAGLGLGLIFYGRPWMLQFLLGRKRSSSRKTGWSSLNEN